MGWEKTLVGSRNGYISWETGLGKSEGNGKERKSACVGR